MLPRSGERGYKPPHLPHLFISPSSPVGLDNVSACGYHGAIMRSIIAAIGLLFTLTALPSTVRSAAAPAYLPKYDVSIDLNIEKHTAQVSEHVTWTNRHQRPAGELVFNVHSAFKPPDCGVEYLYLAKMLEIMRIPAKEALYNGRPVEIRTIWLEHPSGDIKKRVELPFTFRDDMPTALVVTLPEALPRGQTVKISIDFEFRIPPNQGRWGQWKGVTVLSNWLPVLAYYDEKGWSPTPFIAWHQPFFNEAGVYNVHLRLPADQKVGTSGPVRKTEKTDKDQQLWIGPVTTREFTIVCSTRFEEHSVKAGDVTVKCLAFPEHQHHAQNVVRIAARAVETYTKWFGPYPNKELVFCECYFGWNGNECSGLVMVDERVFNMPKLAAGYIEYLISHETCHQWFYNVIGTDGYRETFMDEAFANYFAHRLVNQNQGRNNAFFEYPDGFKWLPNVHREDYRFGSFYNTIGRNELGPPLQEMQKYKHVVNLFSAAYDRGSKIVGMIEDRLGEAAFLDFMRTIYSKYYFRIIFAADFQRELEEYTGQSWAEFFNNWLHDTGLTDWKLDDAEVTHVKTGTNAPYKAVIYVKQQGQVNEPTSLGFKFGGSEGYPVRVPVAKGAEPFEIESPPGRIETMPDGRVRIEVLLPGKPSQITIDPDQILPDKNPANNHWKHEYRFRATYVYTFLDENDMTAAYDRWNYTVGPWLYGPSYADPWFTRSTVVGVRAGAFRTQDFSGGVYTGYRTDFRDMAAGFDAKWRNPFAPKTEIGIHGEKSIAAIDSSSTDLDRVFIYHRYLFTETASLYTAPTHYAEAFAAWQQNFLPVSRNQVPGAVRYNTLSQLGVHYHLDLLTPYWDPEMGFKFDITYAAGLPVLGQERSTQQVMGQLSWVHKLLPCGHGYLSKTKLAYRVFGGISTPSNAELFSLGGNLLFRGFDLQQRQGSAMWVASVEWRLPIIEDVEWDTLDHFVGLRNFYLAPFYDAGDIYVRERSVGEVAHAVGMGLRAEVAWLSFIERTTLRLDVAQTVNVKSPTQFWIGIMHPF